METKNTTKKKRTTNYLNNKDMLAEVIKSKEQEQITDKLALMFQLLVSKYAKKGNWSNYTFNEDMQSYATLMLVKTWNSFNVERSSNPFAFFTQCVKNSFKQYIKYEKNQRNTRDALLVKQGLSPSLTYQMENQTVKVEDEEDYDQVKETAQKLKNEYKNTDSESV